MNNDSASHGVTDGFMLFGIRTWQNFQEKVKSCNRKARMAGGAAEEKKNGGLGRKSSASWKTHVRRQDISKVQRIETEERKNNVNGRFARPHDEVRSILAAKQNKR
jgi:hypothetical protein